MTGARYRSDHPSHKVDEPHGECRCGTRHCRWLSILLAYDTTLQHGTAERQCRGMIAGRSLGPVFLGLTDRLGSSPMVMANPLVSAIFCSKHSISSQNTVVGWIKNQRKNRFCVFSECPTRVGCELMFCRYVISCVSITTRLIERKETLG